MKQVERLENRNTATLQQEVITPALQQMTQELAELYTAILDRVHLDDTACSELSALLDRTVYDLSEGLKDVTALKRW